MTYTNLIVNQLESEGRSRVYMALQYENVVKYTTNLRAVPNSDNIYSADGGVKVCIGLAEGQEEYFNKKVYSISYIGELVEEKGLKDKIDIDNIKHIETLQRHIKNQYTLGDIKKYLKEYLTS